MEVKLFAKDDLALAVQLVDELWGDTKMVLRGQLVDVHDADGAVLVYDGAAIAGILTYIILEDKFEILTFNSLIEHKGVGRMLMDVAIQIAKESHYDEVWVLTTNDNTRALKFYQRYGFALVRVNFNALDASRQLKPEIPEFGADNIRLDHEFILKLALV
ncbi:GNAT family N-acetyltransferase [Culicoidibacter larvae]|uniref:GNAT family N-acetyltransferase n=1 Tax=Culicoidibacter larvae TaxID=2579976 RepID=A0A5R8Q7R9_9FIRM|nr:GNAT family N-acetyltransferase [Culicoidibacter larvae]TLG71524.1 GNAT family N-acetyltransferase [Culicoidibacter larvae]